MALPHWSRARRNILEIFEQGKLRLPLTASNPAGLIQSRHREHVEQAKTFPVSSKKTCRVKRTLNTLLKFVAAAVDTHARPRPRDLRLKQFFDILAQR